MSPEHYDAGINFPGGSGTTNVGFTENQNTHPYSSNVVAGTNTASLFEVD